MGVIDRNEKVVCVTTGNLLKDPEEAIQVSEKLLEVEAKYDEIIKHLG